MKRQPVVFILISVLISMLTAACACSAPAEETETMAGTEYTSGEIDFGDMSFEDQEAFIRSALPEADYEGYEFKFLTRDTAVYVDLISDSMNGEPVNDAVYERNSYIEEKYNIKISALTGGSEPVSAAMKFISADEDAFDAVSDGLSNLASVLITEGALLDVRTIEGLDLDGRWWDTKLIEGFDIRGKSYLLTGDISVTDDHFTMALLFNKDIAVDYSLGDIYALIGGGTWTIDRMYDMAKTTAGDINGDGVLGLGEDRWGLLSERYGTYGFWTAAGQRVTAKNEEGLLEFSLFNDRSVSVFAKAFEFQRDAGTTWLNIVSGGNPYADMLTAFGSGRALFYYGGLTNTMTLRSSDADFGIITMPKYDEEQKEYYNCVSVWNCLAFGVPITGEGAVGSDRTGTILGSMAAVSKYTLTPAYYDITLKGKLSRDNESEAMLDLLMSTRVYDLGTIFDWGGSFSIFYNMTNSGESNFASEYAAVEQQANAELDAFNRIFG